MKQKNVFLSFFSYNTGTSYSLPKTYISKIVLHSMTGQQESIYLSLTLSAPAYFCPILPPPPSSPPLSCVNPDRKILLTLNLPQSHFAMLQKMVGKNFKNRSYRDGDVTNYVNFLKKCAKNS